MVCKQWLSGRVMIVLLCVCIGACDRTEDIVRSGDGKDASGKKLTSSSVSALQIIDECKQAYQKLNTYQDEAYVRLAYRMKSDVQGESELLEDRAPLSVALQKPGLIGIRAYSIEAGPSEGRWRLRLRDSDNSAVAGQVISRAVPAKADFNWLLSDPAIADELAAGLAGFPPQLDMLLGPNPMNGLIDQAAQIQVDAPETVGGEICHTLRITRGPLVYRLWISQENMLLRRLQLPSANLTPAMLADKNITEVQLTIELAGIRTDEAIDWSKYEIGLPDRPKLVSRFVPAPLPMQLDRLGVKLPAFRLRTADGQTAFSSAESTDKITVLAWLADHPACKETAEQLAAIAASVGASQAAGRVQFVNVWAEPQPAEGSTFQNLADQWRLPGKLALDSEAVGRDLFGITEAPTVVVIDGTNRLQIIEERSNPYLPQLMPSLLVRLANGDDLAAEVIANTKLDRERHEAELLMAAAVDANLANFPKPTSYAARTIEVTALDNPVAFTAENPLVALTVDDSQMIWILTADGTLRREDPSTKAVRKFQTRWSVGNPASAASLPNARMEVSPDGQFVAYSSPESGTVDLFDTKIEQNRTVRLADRENVVDLRWMKLAGTKSPRLAVVTTNKQTKLLDPNNQEQLSGICPTMPLALIPKNAPDALVGGYVVLEDRAIESLLLSADSAHAVPLGRPASYSDSSTDDARGKVATLPSKKSAVPTKVAFQPAAGPWKSVQTQHGLATLARGWIAQDEPGVFLLNEQLQQQWHYRMPLESDRNAQLIATANIDPATSQPLWALSQSNAVVHLLRGDGAVTDHMRLQEPVRGLALVPVGNRLMLYVAHQNKLVTYRIGK